MKKKMGKFRNRDNGQFGNSLLKTHPWASKRSKFKYFTFVINIIIINIIVVVNEIILNLEIVEAVLIYIVQLFPDPEDFYD